MLFVLVVGLFVDSRSWRSTKESLSAHTRRVARRKRPTNIQTNRPECVAVPIIYLHRHTPTAGTTATAAAVVRAQVPSYIFRLEATKLHIIPVVRSTDAKKCCNFDQEHLLAGCIDNLVRELCELDQNSVERFFESWKPRDMYQVPQVSGVHDT